MLAGGADPSARQWEAATRQAFGEPGKRGHRAPEGAGQSGRLAKSQHGSRARKAVSDGPDGDTITTFYNPPDGQSGPKGRAPAIFARR